MKMITRGGWRIWPCVSPPDGALNPFLDYEKVSGVGSDGSDGDGRRSDGSGSDA